MVRFMVWLLAATGFAALAAGCGETTSGGLRIELDDQVEIPERPAIIFFVDALDPVVLDRHVAAGRLPHIERLFFDGGVGVDHAISSMPSITYPNCSSLITGRFPGHHGIMGNFWFDRFDLECRYYMTYGTYRTVNDHLAVPTLFDLLHDRFTLNIQGHTRRGVTQTIDNADVFAWAWVWGDYTAADRHVGDCLADAADLANRVGRWPVVIMTYYPGVDEVGHQSGPASEDYARALITIDDVVGRVAGALDEAGLGDRMTYVLCSDHGMAPAEERMDLVSWLSEKRGLRLRTTPIDLVEYDDRWNLMQRYDGVANVDAGRVAMLHLKGERGWAHRPSVGEVMAWLNAEPAVLDLPAIEMVVVRDGTDRVRALSRRGAARIERRRDESGVASCRVAEYAGDPLGYREDPDVMALVESGWHGSRTWLAKTAGSRCPDFVPQIVEMFDSSRTGDVVFLAADDWNLYPRERGGHGSCLPRDMRITLRFAGPGLPAGASVSHARLVDITPTLLGLLGEAHRLDTVPPIDGINLADRLRTAGQ